MVLDLSRLRDKPKGHASYRVLPRGGAPDRLKPIRFTAESDDRARFIFRHAQSTLMAQGIPLLELVLERRVDGVVGEADVWAEVPGDA